MIRIMNIYVSKNRNLKVFNLLGTWPFPWGQIEIHKRRSGKITEIWIRLLNIDVVIRLTTILKDVKKWTKQGYMPSFEDWCVSEIIKWPRDIKED